MSATILIVDDDPVQRRLLEGHINKLGYRVRQAGDGEAALEALQDPGGEPVAAVVLDLVMPGLDGMGTLSKMRQAGLRQPVIVQTAQGGIDTVVSAVRAGAVDFCVKPVSFERLKISLANALKLEAMEHAVQGAQKRTSGTLTFDDMIGQDEAMARVLTLGKRAADSSIPVLIEGESGTGKEVLARAIHGSGPRKGKPFVAVNCGALPEALAESLLFGHEKGAFTGATSSHVGKFKEADGGTLFLDEVGELSPELQVKLLRAIQEGEIDPVGARQPVKTDFRLVSATNRDMIAMVKAGAFREDLYYRLNVFPVMLPPLRKRRGDIAPLVRHLTARICLEEGRRGISGIRRDALAMLEAQDWPGNIRQLENALFRAIVLCDGDELSIDDFPQLAVAAEGSADQSDDTVIRLDEHMTPPLQAEPVATNAMPSGLTDASGAPRDLEAIEADAIANAIDYHGGRMTRVARSLGIGRSTLYRKLKQYDLVQAATNVPDSD